MPWAASAGSPRAPAACLLFVPVLLSLSLNTLTAHMLTRSGRTRSMPRCSCCCRRRSGSATSHSAQCGQQLNQSTPNTGETAGHGACLSVAAAASIVSDQLPHTGPDNATNQPPIEANIKESAGQGACLGVATTVTHNLKQNAQHRQISYRGSMPRCSCRCRRRFGSAAARCAPRSARRSWRRLCHPVAKGARCQTPAESRSLTCPRPEQLPMRPSVRPPPSAPAPRMQLVRGRQIDGEIELLRSW